MKPPFPNPTQHNIYFSWTTHKEGENNFRATVTANTSHAEMQSNGRHVTSETYWSADGFTSRARAKTAAINARRDAKAKLDKSGKYNPI